MENLREILGRLDTVKDVNNDHIPPDQIEDQAAVLDCNICGGKGWLTPIVPTGHPDFGSLKACECRSSVREDEITRRLLAYSNLGYLSQYTFESLDECNHSLWLIDDKEIVTNISELFNQINI